MLEVFDFCSPSLLQHDFLEFVDDKVLADTCDSIFAVLLSVDANDTGRRLDLFLVDFLLLQDVFGQELQQKLAISASPCHEAALLELLKFFFDICLITDDFLLRLLLRLLFFVLRRVVGWVFTNSLEARVLLL